MILRAQDVVKTFSGARLVTARRGGSGQVMALRSVSLEVSPGERLGIVGESGSGKTTLVKILAALESASSGEVWYAGESFSQMLPQDFARVRTQIQFVFQDPNSSLNPRMKVADIITEPIRSVAFRKAHGKLARAAIDHKVVELLDMVGLASDSARRYPHEFSGGQRQRIAIARALSSQPRVLIADEPVSALDVSVRAQILNLLGDLVNEQGLTLLFVGHDLSVVRHLCNQVIVMRQGEIVERGTTAAVLSSPRTEYAQELLSAVPRITLSR